MKKSLCLILLFSLFLPLFAEPAAPSGSTNETDLTKSWKPEKGSSLLVDHTFSADPTAVEYEGRLYVYGTSDQEEFEYHDRVGKNTYAAIKSLVIYSTDDMANWTFHGAIDVRTIAPWILASWAPSICSRVESDGKTHFYLYFSNSGTGVGVLTATSPLGPWTDPLGHNLIDKSSPGLGDCEAPFDPGVVIDTKGTGWLAFGGGTPNKTGSDYMPGNARLVRLGPDMLSLGSRIIEIKAPYHFEANELNVLGDTLVYTYNNNWAARDHWDFAGSLVPSACSMAYMVSDNPLEPSSWTYVRHYFKNPGNYGMEYSNNHTHLQKFKGKWYLFFHTLILQKAQGVDGGYRSLCVAELEVDEAKHDIPLGKPARSGVPAIKALDPFVPHAGSLAWRTAGITFPDSLETLDPPGVGSSGSWIAVRQADFSKKPRSLVMKVSGKGTVEVHLDSGKGQEICRLDVQSPEVHESAVPLSLDVSGVHDLYFVFRGEGWALTSWYFTK